MKLTVSQAARADLARLHAFLAEENPNAARRIVTILVDAIQSIEIFPERGRPTATRGVRELVVPFGRSGYVLRYAYSTERDEVVVLRIAHGREGK